MPAPVSAATRLPWNGTAAAPPPEPAPSLLDSIPAAYRSSVDGVPWEQEGRLNDAYKPVVDALSEGLGLPSLARASPYYRRVGAGRATAMMIDRERVWQDIARARAADAKAFGDLPATREEFESAARTRFGAYQRDRALAARGGIVPQLIGGVAAQAVDPVNLLVGAMSGGLSAGTSLLRGMVIEGALNAGIDAVEMPATIDARRKLGEQPTTGDMAMELGEALVFGAGLHGLGKAVKAGWERLPEGLRTRWRARAALDPPGQDILTADISEALIGPERMTDSEAGAAAALRSEGEVASASPFVPNGAGLATHDELLADRMAAIMQDSPPERRPSAPGAPVPAASGDAQGRFMAKARAAESSGDDAAQAATSSAFGRYQFTKGTWYSYYVRRFGAGGLNRAEIYAKRADAGLQDMLMADLTADNAARLRGIGAPETEGNLYLMHLLGPADAEKVLRAGGDTALEGLIKPGSIKANAFMRKMTVADIREFAARKMGSAGDDGAGLHLNPAAEMHPEVRAEIDAELAAVRAQTATLEAELRSRGMDTEALVRDAVATDAPERQALPVEDVGPGGEPLPLAEPAGALAPPAPAATDSGVKISSMHADDAPDAPQRWYTMQADIDGQKVEAEIRLNRRTGEATLDVWGADANALGPAAVMRAARQIAAEIPEAKTLSGVRVSGGKAKSRAAARTAGAEIDADIGAVNLDRLRKAGGGKGVQDVSPSAPESGRLPDEAKPTKAAGREAKAGPLGRGEARAPDLAEMPREEAARFIDPAGDAAMTQVDSLAHDAQMGGGRQTVDLGDGAAEVKDILRKLNAEEADNATIRECMIPKPEAGE